jgi:hypothetical protein
MKQHIIYLYNMKQRIKRELQDNSTIAGLQAYNHINNRLKDCIGVE